MIDSVLHGGKRLPPPGMAMRSASVPSVRHAICRMPSPCGAGCSTTAPAPSPNSTQVVRSVQSR